MIKVGARKRLILKLCLHSRVLYDTVSLKLLSEFCNDS
jgi:hypothetical protein